MQLRRAHGEARVAGTPTIDLATVSRTLQQLQIDSRGLGLIAIVPGGRVAA